MNRSILFVNLIVIIELTGVLVFLFHRTITHANLAGNDKDIAIYYVLLFSFLLTVVPVYYLGNNLFLSRKGKKSDTQQKTGVYFLLVYGLLLAAFWLSALETINVYMSGTIFLIIGSILFLAYLTFGGQDGDPGNS